MGDVGKGTAVNKSGSPLQRLDEVRLDGVLEQSGHGAFGFQVVSSDRLAIVGVADNDPGKTGFEVHQVRSEAQHGHDLTGNRDVKTILTGNALRLPAEPVDNMTELTVIHVHGALPGDLLRIDAESIALLNVVIQHGSQKVVGRADGMEVTGEVEVDILHGNNLGIAAAGCTALDAEDRAERGLAQRDNGVLSDLAQTVGEADGGGGFPFTGRRRGDGGVMAVTRMSLPFSGRSFSAWRSSLALYLP